MKFSIITPVYNTEKYLKKCIDSVLNQSYGDFEMIIVNNGSEDNSQAVIDEYVKKDARIKSYFKEEGRLSGARNFGIEMATGDYFLFLDSDDYFGEDLLLNLNNVITDEDIVRFNIRLVDEKYNEIRRAKEYETKKHVNFKELFNIEYFQPVCCSAYSTKFWKEHNFKFAEGRIHEDFGMTPYVTLVASKRTLLNYYGYNYFQRPGSIMNGGQKATKRASDMLYHFDALTTNITELEGIDKSDKALALSYVTNNVISMVTLLDGEDKAQFIAELKKRKVAKYMLADTFNRKLKKIVATISLKAYIKIRFK